MYVHSRVPHVVILGGGFGGLESAFYLRFRLRDRVRITLISDSDRFLFKPNTIYIPFGLDPERLLIPLDRPARRQGIDLRIGRVRDVQPDRQVVEYEGGSVSYDYLIVATGAGMRPAEVPGLSEFAQTIWTPEEMLRLREALQKLRMDLEDGATRTVLFLVPPHNKCSGPLYELVFMVDTWLRRLRLRGRARILWTTYEQSFIQAFGPRLHEVVESEFARRGITGYTRWVVDRVEAKSVVYQNGERVDYDLLIAFPPYVAAVQYPTLPTDERGFLHTELSTRRVVGLDNVYAVGDTSDFPVKQAFLAFLQADAVAEHISRRVSGQPVDGAFEPVSMCVMEMLDKATFAQVPLQVTGDPTLPVVVRPEAGSMYRVGTSPVWRLGRKLLGLYLPWRFRNGRPFHAGAPWRAMELGLKVMSTAWAH